MSGAFHVRTSTTVAATANPSSTAAITVDTTLPLVLSVSELQALTSRLIHTKTVQPTKASRPNQRRRAMAGGYRRRW